MPDALHEPPSSVPRSLVSSLTILDLQTMGFSCRSPATTPNLASCWRPMAGEQLRKRACWGPTPWAIHRKLVGCWVTPPQTLGQCAFVRSASAQDIRITTSPRIPCRYPTQISQGKLWSPRMKDLHTFASFFIFDSAKASQSRNGEELWIHMCGPQLQWFAREGKLQRHYKDDSVLWHGWLCCFLILGYGHRCVESYRAQKFEATSRKTWPKNGFSREITRINVLPCAMIKTWLSFPCKGWSWVIPAFLEKMANVHTDSDSGMDDQNLQSINNRLSAWSLGWMSHVTPQCLFIQVVFCLKEMEKGTSEGKVPKNKVSCGKPTTCKTFRGMCRCENWALKPKYKHKHKFKCKYKYKYKI